MDEHSRLILEQEGFKVIQREHVDAHWGTRNFVEFPDGRILSLYSYLFEIPSWLNDHDEFTLLRTAVPEEIRNRENYDIDLWGFDENLVVHDGASLEPISLIGLALIIIISAVIFLGIYFIVDKVLRPCGEGYTEWLSDCWKVIVTPDCRYRTFNSCADPDGDGIPEGEWGNGWEGGVPDIGAIIKWIAIGAVAVGVIVVAVKVLPSFLEKRASAEPIR